MFEHTLEHLVCPEDLGQLVLADRFETSSVGEVVEGLLRCSGCGRWFRVESGVPDLVRDTARDRAADELFLQRHAQRLPAWLTSSEARPYGPAGTDPTQLLGADAAAMLDAARERLRRFWETRDKKLQALVEENPRLPVPTQGVDGELASLLAAYPRNARAVLFRGVERLSGRVALALGHGSSEFALAYGLRGLNTIGVDTEFESLAAAREEARTHSLANVEFVRGELSNPPIPKASVDVFLAKDSLWNLPDLQGMMERSVLPLLRPGARAFIEDRVGRAPLKEALLSRLSPPLLAMIRARYPDLEIPPHLLRPVAEEDKARDQENTQRMARVRPSIYRFFEPETESWGMWLHLDVEAMVYLASGRDRLMANLSRRAALLAELALKPFQPVERWTFRGRLRKRLPSAKGPRSEAEE